MMEGGRDMEVAMRINRPLNRKKRVQIVVIAFILVWATQTLLSQWGYGAEVFVRDPSRAALVEVRGEATVHGSAVKLRQIARWAEVDRGAMDEVGDLIVLNIPADRTSATIDLDALKQTLGDAGINVGQIQFAGARVCQVIRVDPQVETAVEQAVKVHLAKVNASEPARPPAVASSFVAPLDRPQAYRTLREVLTAELAERFNLDPEALQIRFDGKDEKTLGLSEPAFKFNVSPGKERNLGTIVWNVGVAGGAGAEQKVKVTATARAWQNQLVTARAVSFKQIFKADDVQERRVLVDRLDGEVSLKAEQVVGQQAARDMGPGWVLGSKLIDPVQLVRMGQLITVTVDKGGVSLKWVAEAREAGAYGQVIRVRKPQTREEFSVLLTGPEQAKLVMGGGDGNRVAVR